jgi:DNA-binding LacI/PurR family transcriptional regulator
LSHHLRAFDPDRRISGIECGASVSPPGGLRHHLLTAVYALLIELTNGFDWPILPPVREEAWREYADSSIWDGHRRASCLPTMSDACNRRAGVLVCAKRFAAKRFVTLWCGLMATIDDVARHAGVGRTTVSHALSGNRHVAPATRDRILAVVDELGYQPNAAARSLVSRRTMTVGLIVPLDLDILAENRYTDFLVAVGDRLNEHGYHLLCLIDRNPVPLDVRRLIRSNQVDGALLLQVRTVDARVAALAAEGRPFVTIGRPRNCSGIVRADGDFVRAAEIAVDHLSGLGHEKIALLATGRDESPVFGFQWYTLKGFRRAHRTRGLKLSSAQILLHDRETPESVAAALAPVCDGTLPLTALVTTTFVAAALAMQALAEHGLRVPEDVSIVALGDPRATLLPLPSITVARFSVTDLAHAAVDLLLGVLEGRQPARSEHLVPVELVVRNSSGPANPARVQSRARMQGNPVTGQAVAAAAMCAAVSVASVVGSAGGLRAAAGRGGRGADLAGSGVRRP